MKISKSIKMAWHYIKLHPVLSAIQIAATAVTICMVMLQIAAYEMQNMPIRPETNRKNFLIWSFISQEVVDSTDQKLFSGHISEDLYAHCFTNLKHAETSALYSFTHAARVSSPHQAQLSRCINVRLCNGGYWQALDFDFIDGRPFTEAECQTNPDVVVISRSAARKILGTSDAVGREIDINRNRYTIVGVVEDPMAVTRIASGDAWIPYTQRDEAPGVKYGGKSIGGFNALAIVPHDGDADSLANEMRTAVDNYGHNILGCELRNYNQPYDTNKSSLVMGVAEPDTNAAIKHYLFYLIMMLIVPTINISSVTHSRLSQRMTEMAVYRTFGATRWFVAWQVFLENLVTTVIAGVIGFVGYVIFILTMGDLVFGFNTTFEAYNTTPELLVDWQTALDPRLLAYALFFCIVINILCCIGPIWKYTRKTIAESFNRQQ